MVNWSRIILHLLSGEAGIGYLLWIARVVALTVLSIWILAAVVSADKRTVLYMRRFRAHGPQARMRRTLEAGLGRRYRLVTLSDGVFQPLEVPPLERWFNRAVLPLLAVVFVLGSSIFVYLAPLVFLGAPLFLAPIIAGFLLLRYRVRRRARIAVRRTATWRRASRASHASSAGGRGPRASPRRQPSSRCRTNCGKTAVARAVAERRCSRRRRQLGQRQPPVGAGAPVRVRISTLRAVAERDPLAAWSEGPGDPTAERCRALLKDQSVLVYRGNGLVDRRRFGRSLKRLLDQAVTDLWPTRTEETAAVLRPATAM